MAMIWHRCAFRLFGALLVSVVMAQRCSAQAPASTAPPLADSSRARYELGVTISTYSSIQGSALVPTGVCITAVAPGSPAQQSGLEPGDIITVANGWSVTSPPALQWVIANSGGQATLGGQKARSGTRFQIPPFPLVSQPIAATPFPSAYGSCAPRALAYGQWPYCGWRSPAYGRFSRWPIRACGWCLSSRSPACGQYLYYAPQLPPYGQGAAYEPPIFGYAMQYNYGAAQAGQASATTAVPSEEAPPAPPAPTPSTTPAPTAPAVPTPHVPPQNVPIGGAKK
jgi:hypothetical protein